MDNKPKFKPLVIIQCYEDREAPPKISRRQEAPQEKSLSRHSPELESTPPPPPPPPPFDNSDTPAPLQTKTKTPPPVPAKYSTLSHTKDDYPQPPPCPPPDYDTISINSTSTLAKVISKTRNDASQNDLVEMVSLESYTLNNPNNQPPKPPNTYFKTPLASRLSNGSTTSTISNKKQRPVSVTIGEYQSGSLRRQPGKLDFLQNGCNGEADRMTNGSITTQFASELAHTLSRSNLRKRTESMENLLNNPQIQAQSNGAVTISLNNANKLAENNFKLGENKSNRVTINICSIDKKTDIPNGILKNGNGNHNFHNSNHKTLVQQKSITFGEMPTVINDRLLQIT